MLGFPAIISFCHVIMLVKNTSYWHFYIEKKSFILKERPSEGLCPAWYNMTV